MSEPNDPVGPFASISGKTNDFSYISLYAGQEAEVRTRHGTMDWFKIGKGVHQGSMLSPCLF